MGTTYANVMLSSDKYGRQFVHLTVNICLVLRQYSVLENI